ncbi:hypothetical protein FRC08_000138 [Ceratobasidium sp. 394]|nr:hypothetical protein FRC08_000138 [Ceratobasidium sp. 394]
MFFQSTGTVSKTSTTPRDPSTTLISASSTSPSSTIISTILTDPLRTTPAAISLYVILTILFVIGMAFHIHHWRRKRQGDFILPTRSTRSKAYLIDVQARERQWVD